MTLNERQRGSLLGILLVATLAATAVSSNEEEGDGVVQPIIPKSTPAEVEVTSVEKNPKVSRLDLARIDRDPNEAIAIDVFAPKSWYKPPPPPLQSAAAQPAAPVAPALPFKYVGQLGEVDGKVTIYLAKGEKVYIVRVGEVLDEQYRLDAIHETHLTFTFIPMDKQQALAVPPK